MNGTAAQTTDTKTAKLYRMVMPKHICPYGLKSKDLLERQGYEVEDHHLTTREETDAFMEKHDVETTPQTFVGDRRIGGYDDLRVYFKLDPPEEDRSDTTYRPVIAIFAVALLLALGLSWHQYGTPVTLRAAEWFVSLSMTILAIQKLQDVESFSTMFLNYDLLAMRWVPYSRIYPYAEAFAGILMTAGALVWLSAPVSFCIGLIGAVSIFKAVYLEKRELKCACVGGSSSVPLGFVSLTESLMMTFMGLWMPFRMLVLQG
jgi:glutaredoxin